MLSHTSVADGVDVERERKCRNRQAEGKKLYKLPIHFEPESLN